MNALSDPLPTLDASAELFAMFETAPVPLSLEDYGALRQRFDQWREQGVTDLRAWLQADGARVVEVLSLIRLIRVNKRTLELFGAESTEHMVASMHLILRDDMHERYIEELVMLWEGRDRFTSQTVNYSIQGKRLDVVLSTQIMPGHEARWDRVLVSIEDMTERMESQRALARSEAYARTLFEHSPVSLWVEDFSAVKLLIDEVRAAGVTDFRTFTDVHPEFVQRCMQEVRVVDVNRQTLTMFSARDRQSLLKGLHEIFRDDALPHFAEQLIDLWHGKIFQQREVLNYALTGEAINVYQQFSVMPGHERDWSLVLVSLTDITARKKAEAYLEFLGKHDSLTKLRNRSFFADELNRLERRGPWPVTLMVLDLNGLKTVNDEQGHAGGDALLRRAGEVLAKVVDKPACAARIGGDEFALLLPATSGVAAEAMEKRVQELAEMNNQFYGGTPLSFSIGMATVESGERIEAALHLADQRMYANKWAYYESTGLDRRGLERKLREPGA